jgi:hypothetical protein
MEELLISNNLLEGLTYLKPRNQLYVYIRDSTVSESKQFIYSYTNTRYDLQC